MKMKLTETILRKIIKEQIDDYLEYIPPTEGIPGEDSSSEQPRNRPTRPRFSERLEACVQTGKPIMLKVDVKTFQSNASSSYPTHYTLDGEKRTSYRTANTLPTSGELFKVLKFVGGPSYYAYTDAEVIGTPSRRTTRSGELSVVMLQHDKFGKFTIALLPNEVGFAK